MMIPAIDLIDGQVVRLFQGDYSQKTNYKTTVQERQQAYACLLYTSPSPRD